MGNIDFDKLLYDTSEDAYEITLCNKRFGIKESVPVYPSNTLKQVIEEYYYLIGIPENQLPSYLKNLDIQIKLHFSGLMLDYMEVVPNDLSVFDGVFDINSTLKKLGINSGCTLYLER